MIFQELSPGTVEDVSGSCQQPTSIRVSAGAQTEIYVRKVGYEFCKRLLDICIATILLIALSAPLVLIAIAIKLSSKGPVCYWSDRVGRDNHVFRMVKFRTMLPKAPEVATENFPHPEAYVTVIGKWLRRTSLDELPQLLNIIRGEMSFVGPRPVITGERQLLKLRTKSEVHRVMPGITGWAQVNGRDFVSGRDKVALDAYYVQKRSLRFDAEIIFRTVWKVLLSKDIAH